MKLLWIAVLLAGGLAAQQETVREPSEAPKEKQTSEKAPPDDGGEEEQKATRREKAQELLDAAAETVTSALPEVQAVGLMHIADNYTEFDREKALEYFHQAFVAASGLPVGGSDSPQHRLRLEHDVVNRVANVDVEEAIRLLRRMSPPAGGFDLRKMAAGTIVSILVRGDDLDRTIEFIESLDPSMAYPYRALDGVLGKLPPEDPRRVVLFGNAMAAYPGRPDQGFGWLLAQHWRDLPRGMVQSSLQMITRRILDYDNKYVMTQSLSSAKGSVHFGSRQDIELFDLMHVLREIAPKRAEEILEGRLELRAAVEKFPEGAASMKNEEGSGIHTSSYVGSPDPRGEGRRRLAAIAQSRAMAASSHLPDNPDKALSAVEEIPLPAIQADVLGAIARSVSGNDAAQAKAVLNRCATILDEMDNLMDKMGPWDAMIEAAHKIGDRKLAWEFIDTAIDDAAELYKRDSDAESPNRALREYWPSTQSYRGIVWRATDLFGAEAQPLLSKIGNPDLALLARVEMAQSLLDRPRSHRNIHESRPRSR